MRLVDSQHFIASKDLIDPVIGCLTSGNKVLFRLVNVYLCLVGSVSTTRPFIIAFEYFAGNLKTQFGLFARIKDTNVARLASVMQLCLLYIEEMSE